MEWGLSFCRPQENHVVGSRRSVQSVDPKTDPSRCERLAEKRPSPINVLERMACGGKPLIADPERNRRCGSGDFDDDRPAALKPEQASPQGVSFAPREHREEGGPACGQLCELRLGDRLAQSAPYRLQSLGDVGRQVRDAVRLTTRDQRREQERSYPDLPHNRIPENSRHPASQPIARNRPLHNRSQRFW